MRTDGRNAPLGLFAFFGTALAVATGWGATNPMRLVREEIGRGANYVSIPKGIYEITPDASDPTVYFRLKGLVGVTVDFNGAELSGCVKTRMFDLAGCTNVTIRNVVIDFRDLPFTQAVIERVDAERTWDVRVIDGYPRPDMRVKTQALDSHDDFWPIQAYDGRTHELKNPMRYLDKVAIVQTGPDTYRISGGRDRRGDVGDIAVWSVSERGCKTLPENVNAVRCAGLVFENVTQYSTPHGRAFIDWESSGTTYRACRVVRRPSDTERVKRGLPRLRSGNHDAFISKNAYRGPKILDCTAEYHCDDCVNVSGAYQVIYEGTGSVVRVFVHGLWDLQLDAGDLCQLMTPTGEVPPPVRVVAVKPGPPISKPESDYLVSIGLWPGIAESLRKSYLLTLDRAFDLPRGTVLASESRMGNGFVIRNCRFGSTRGRGLLLKASHGLVENCEVNEAVCVTTEYEWLSAGIAHDLVFRNNRFRKPVFFGGHAAHGRPLPKDVNRNVVVEPFPQGAQGRDLTANERLTRVTLQAMRAEATETDANGEVLEIAKDRLGALAACIDGDEDWEVWAKPLMDGSVAAALCNRTLKPRRIVLRMEALGMMCKWRVRDVWSREDEGVFLGEYDTLVDAQASHLVKLTPMPCGYLREGAMRQTGFVP